MPEYVWIVGLLMYGASVACQFGGLMQAKKMADMATRTLEAQRQALAEMG